MKTIIKTNHLTKTFKGVEVVSSVNMTIKKGEIYGFLGPNGAGKTTIIKLLMNLLKPTSGEITIFDEVLHHKSYEYLKRVGSLIENPVFYDKLTGYENLQLHCEYMGFYKEDAIEEALKLVNLFGVNSKAVKEYSLGMKQRLGIARAIVTKPEILILDEPINGLDPIGIKEMRQLFKKLSKDYGMTILISSHIISEIELIADTIGIIHKGHLVEEISCDKIRDEQTEYIEFIVDDTKKALFVLDNVLKVKNMKVIDNKKIRVYDIKQTTPEILAALVSKSVAVHGVSEKISSLEDYFLNLVEGGEVSV